MKLTDEVREFSHHFRAMGTDIDIWLWNSNSQRAQNALRGVERFFAQIEARLSRFRPDSELSRLNRSSGTPFNASPVLFNLVAEALAWRQQTKGIFDPAILPALVRCGYDRSFTLIKAEPSPAPSAVAQAADWSRAPIDSTGIVLGPGRRIYVPPGGALDLGGIAKGWTAQQAVHRLAMWGPCMVDAGGDIVTGGGPPGEPWVITVADPRNAALDLAILDLNSAAVATSSQLRRRWIQDGRPAHHLIDPRTGAPAQTAVLSVTVVAPRLPDAEIYAKTALILGEMEGTAYLADRPDVSALFVMNDGRLTMCGGFEERAYVPSTSDFTARFQIPGHALGA